MCYNNFLQTLPLKYKFKGLLLFLRDTLEEIWKSMIKFAIHLYLQWTYMIKA
jgi:hypothetical protein